LGCSFHFFGLPRCARNDGLPNNEAEVVMKTMTRAITPGQACVIYQDSRVLGGGWITKEIV
jgi:tRNA-specific 2-thiouridylase